MISPAVLVGEPKGALWLSFADGASVKGNGEWGMGNGEKILLPVPHSPLPIPHSPFPVFSTAATRVVCRVTVFDCENASGFDHRDARSGLGGRIDVDQGE